eukprot:352291-Chlamydomonas_euryale.AAC.4
MSHLNAKGTPGETAELARMHGAPCDSRRHYPKTARTQILGKHWTRGARLDFAHAFATALMVRHGARADID